MVSPESQTQSRWAGDTNSQQGLPCPLASSVAEMASLPTHPGQETSGFVAPSSYLRRPRGQSHPPTPMAQTSKDEPENAIDRDQRVGLVSLLLQYLSNFETMGACSGLDLQYIFQELTSMASCLAGENTGISKSQDKI